VLLSTGIPILRPTGIEPVCGLTRERPGRGRRRLDTLLRSRLRRCRRLRGLSRAPLFGAALLALGLTRGGLRRLRGLSRNRLRRLRWRSRAPLFTRSRWCCL